jgi:sigma-B regulation protein RsbU (phosphoserine phosphatase)
MNGETLVVGSARQDGLIVYVSEYLTNVLRWVRSQVLLRLGQIVVLALVVGALVNLVLVRVVAKPLESLAVTVAKIAQGQLGAQATSFKTTELACLAEAINSMSSSLADADRRRRQQMAKARSIQEHLLPGSLNVPGLTIAHFYQPAAEVAGDYYDVIGLADGTWLICVADVTGHGVAAAMSAAMLKTLLLHATEHFTGLEELLRYVNQRFTDISLAGDFATMFLVRWDPSAATLEYCGAGHETAWFLPTMRSIRELSSTGMPLGVQDKGDWDSQVVCVGKGDRLFLMTDGAAEAFSPQGKLFGRHRLATTIDGSRGLSLSGAVLQIEQTLAVHRGGNTQSDDATLVAVEFTVPVP